MGIFAKLKSWYLIIILGIVSIMYYNLNKRLDYFEERLDLVNHTYQKIRELLVTRTSFLMIFVLY